MVSKASDDLPEPLTPVTTVIWFMGIEKETFLRLFTRAPLTWMASSDMLRAHASHLRQESGRTRKPRIIQRSRRKAKPSDVRMFQAVAELNFSHKSSVACRIIISPGTQATPGHQFSSLPRKKSIPHVELEM